MLKRQEKEYPKRPCNKTSGGPEPARRYRIRDPSTSAQHSSTPGHVLPGHITEEEFSAILLFTIASFSRADNSFSAGGVYMSDIASVASVFGSFGSPSFLSKTRLNLARKCTEGRSRETK